MASLDRDLVRHALRTAQEHGFAEVELVSEGSAFKAKLEPGRVSKAIPPSNGAVDAGQEPNAEAGIDLIKSPIVGFYRIGSTPLEAGQPVNVGDIVAVVNALGIANDVESPVTGEVTQVLVEDGQAVEYGQVLAKVKA